MNIMMAAGHIDLNPYLVLKVNRNNLIPDTLQKLVSDNINLKKQLKVVFIGEPGIDEGGVRKEFFQLIIKELFDPNYGMFTQNEQRRMFWFNGMSAECNINFELIGIVTGLAISNNVILDMQFPMALYKMLLGQNPNMDDMKEWQPEIASSLEFIANYKNEGTSLKDALDLNFTVERENFGEKYTEELMPGGEAIPVTEENAS